MSRLCESQALTLSWIEARVVTHKTNSKVSPNGCAWPVTTAIESKHDVQVGNHAKSAVIGM